MMGRLKTQRWEKGIGFIEILIAVFVISLAVLGLGQMISSSSETAANSKAHSEALTVAELQLEQLRDFATYDEYDTGIVSSTVSSISGSNALFTPTLTASQSTITDPVTDPSYRQVTVSVAWAGTEGNENAALTTRIAEEKPVEAGAKLLSLADGDQPGFDTIYDPNNLPSDNPDDTTTPTDPSCTDINCTVYQDPIDVTLEGDLDTTGINVYGTIDTRNSSYEIVIVQAFGNFDPVTCPPEIISGEIEQYFCAIGPTTSGESTVWNVTIAVTVEDNNGTCTASNVYTLGELTGAKNFYFPRIGSLTVPAPNC